MKSINQSTLSSSASRRTMTVAQWLSFSNSLLSELLGCPVSNLSAIGVVLFTLLAFAAFLLASDAVQAYGWAAFCALAAFNCALPLFHELQKGGK